MSEERNPFFDNVQYCPKCAQIKKVFDGEDVICNFCGTTYVISDTVVDVSFTDFGTINFYNPDAIYKREDEYIEKYQIDKNPLYDEKMRDLRRYKLRKRRKELENGDEERILKSISENPNKYDENAPTCPICHSTNLSKISTAKKVAKIGMFGIFGMGDTGKTWRCNSCGSKF